MEPYGNMLTVSPIGDDPFLSNVSFFIPATSHGFYGPLL